MLYHNVFMAIFEKGLLLPRITTKFLDKLGISTSGLCALHCLLMPVLVVIMPYTSTTFFAAAWFEPVVLLISLLIALGSTTIGFAKHHRRFYPIIVVAIGGVLYWNKHYLGSELEPVVVILGACLIIAGHWSNYRLTGIKAAQA